MIEYTHRSKLFMTNPYQPPASEIKFSVTQRREQSAKIYSAISLSLATFSGGLLAASFLLLTNFEYQNRKTPAILFIIVATLITILSLFFALFSPLGLVPTHILLNFAEAVLVLIWASRFQNYFYDQHDMLGGTYYSNGRAVFLGIMTSIALYIMLLIASLMYTRLLTVNS